MQQVDDPILPRGGPSIGSLLAAPIQAQGRVRYLDHRSRVRGSRVIGEVVELRAWHHDDVRLRLAPVIQDEWLLNARVKARAKGYSQDPGSAAHDSGMRASRCQLLDNLHVQQFKPLLGAGRSEPCPAVVLSPGPAPRPDSLVRWRHSGWATATADA